MTSCKGLSDRSVLRALGITVLTAALATPATLQAAPMSDLAGIATGGWHTCAVTAVGRAQCWGWNVDGQLGRGNTVDSPVAVNVTGLASGVRAVAAGSRHSCALLATGTVKCWGENFYGQLGTGGLFPSSLPVDVPGVSGLVTVSAGGHHTCGLTAAGGVRCWGNDSWGQLGGNALTSGIAAVVSGYQHACALTDGGGVKCWGANYRGQLGIGVVSNNVAVPTDVAGLTSGVVAIGAGATHSCAALANGNVRCWGSNDAGQLGNGTTVDAVLPVDVQGIANATALALGEGQSCTLTATGGLKCWGVNPGNGSAQPAMFPVDVTGLPGVATMIAGGFQHVCALIENGAAVCWGANAFGALGNGQVGRSASPVDASGVSHAVAIATGADHTCALGADGVVRCWGRNFSGAIGTGDIEDAFLPTPVAIGASVIAVGAGGYSSCAVTSSGAVRCWGLVNGVAELAPADMPGLGSGVVDVEVGNAFGCALTVAGAVKCWGDNTMGQLGNGSTTPSATPVDPIGLSANVVAIGAGDAHACAILSDGSVRCWGANQAGQVTSSPTWSETTPVLVSALGDKALALDLGRAHTCVRTGGLR
jgi:alpha-tubulin suppressor-like RCC1 family protein